MQAKSTSERRYYKRKQTNYLSASGGLIIRVASPKTKTHWAQVQHAMITSLQHEEKEKERKPP